MIKIVENSGQPLSITMTPREVYKRGKRELGFPILFAHVCPICKNIVQAVFKTDKPIDTYPYEEVNILGQKLDKNRGNILEILPNDKHKRKTSCYHTVYDPGLGYQKIVLKNHVLKMKSAVNKAHNGSHLHEPGPKPCLYTGLTSFKEDVLVRDFLLFSLDFDMGKLNGYPLPSLDVIAPPNNDKTKVYIRVPTLGKGPSMIMISKEDLTWGYGFDIEPHWTNYIAGLPAKQEKTK